MNLRCRDELVSGSCLDIGGGEAPSYLGYLQMAKGAVIRSVDNYKPRPNATRVDLETEALPCADGSLDTALLFNVLEHIYKHDRLIADINRSLCSGGKLIGFVPFLVGYHPDPHDYFRYTAEALAKMFEKAGFVNWKIECLGPGPFSAGLNSLLGLGRVVALPAALVWPVANLIDFILIAFRPNMRNRYPLGYYFVATK